MLLGTMIYKDEQYGNLLFDLAGRDSFNDLKLQISIGRTNTLEGERAAMKLFDLQEDGTLAPSHDAITYDSAEVRTRRLDIKKTNKFKTTITNRLFATRISALVRYMQTAGKKLYNQQMDNEFSATRVVDIIELKSKQKIGVIHYNMGIITKLECENKFLRIELDTKPDDKFAEGIFKELKEKDKFGRKLYESPISIVGFKLTEDVLGFHYIPEVVKEMPQSFGMYETIEDVIAAHPDKNTAWILDQEYHIVSDDNLEEVMKMFYEHDGMIAYDTETSGLRINFKSRTNEADQLVGVVLSRKPGEGYYFPLQHKLFDNLCNGDHFYFMDKYMRPLLEEKKIICHNLKFDWKVAYIYDINVNCVYDTMLALGVTKRYEEESYALGLKDLTKNIFGRDSFELSDFVMGGSFGDSEIAFWDLPYELVRQYAPADTDNTYALYEFIEKNKILEKYDARKVFEMEITFAKAVAYSEFYGYHIDVERIPELQEKIVGEMERCTQEMYKIAKKEFNPNSPAQLKEIMYDTLGIESVGEKQSTDKETLKTLASRTNPDGSPKYPFVKLLKTYRDNESIYKNFLKKLPEFATTDGYIFPDVLQIGTNTGRVSVKNPNYQSYNDIVKHYVVPRPDFMHFDSDFAQIEQRVLTSYSCLMFPNEPPLALLKDFDDPDMDYHQYQAARMFNVPYAAVTKSMRQQSKGINFGLPYGMGDESLGTRIFGERNKENTMKAADLRKKFFQGQELIEKFFETVRSDGVREGFTKTQWGRRRYYHKGVFSVNEIRRQAGNHVIQGTAADIYKQAVNNMFDRICTEGWLGKVLINGFIHDEMLIEVHKSINPYYFFKAWRREFQVEPKGYCKLFAGAGVGKCWYDAKKLDLPPLYIGEIIDKYHEDMEWDEDIEGFLADIKAEFKVHKTNRIKSYITDEKSQGEIIKPAISSLLGEEMDVILDVVSNDEEKINALNEILTESKLEVGGSNKIKGLQDQLKAFCYYYDIDYSSIDIKSVDDVVVPKKQEVVEEIFDEDEIDIPIDKEKLFMVGLVSNGIIVDYETQTVYMAEIKLKNKDGFIRGSSMLIQNMLLQKKDDESKYNSGYKIKYFGTIRTENPVGQIIPGYYVPRDNLPVLLDFYKTMLSKNFAYIM